jgi:hypothetical protein
VRLAGLNLQRYQAFGNTVLYLKGVTDIQVKMCYEKKKEVQKKYGQHERKFLDSF